MMSGATISLELNNALLADASNNGAYALPFTIPRTPTNQRLLDFPELLDHAQGSGRTLEQVQVFDDGRHLLSGTLRLLRLTPSSYELTLSYGASAVMAKLKTVKLRQLRLGGLRVWKRGATGQYLDELSLHMNDVMAHPERYDYLFAPFSNNDALSDYPEGEEWPNYANFNTYQLNGFIVTNGNGINIPVMGLPPLTFPDFYPTHKRSCAPLVKLRYLLTTLFSELNIPFEEDFFDAETSQLVVVPAALGEDILITGYEEATSLGLKYDDYWFRLGDVLPDLTCQELIRKVADTFFLDISVSTTGTLRLRRSQDAISLPPARHLSRSAAPAPAVDLSADPVRVEMAYLSEADRYASSHYQDVDPNQLAAPVQTVDDLPALITFEHEVRLVIAENTYYQYDGKEWKLYSVKLDVPSFGPAAGDGVSTVTVTQGCELLLEATGVQTPYLGSLTVTQPTHPVQRVPCFGERAYAPSYNCIRRSKSLRLAFYRGMQPYQTASDGTYPMLSVGNLDLQGRRIGNYSLRFDGDDGTVARFGRGLLQLLGNPDTVTWPVWLSEEQFYQLDLARRVEIDGLHFVIKKVSITFPLRQPAQLDLVLVPPAFSLA